MTLPLSVLDWSGVLPGYFLLILSTALASPHSEDWNPILHPKLYTRFCLAFVFLLSRTRLCSYVVIFWTRHLLHVNKVSNDDHHLNPLSMVGSYSLLPLDWIPLNKHLLSIFWVQALCWGLRSKKRYILKFIAISFVSTHWELKF